MHRTTRMSAGLAALGLAVTGSALGTTTGASAAPSAAPRTTLASHLITPLTAAVQANGTAYVSENFAGMLVQVRPGKAPRPVFRAAKGTEVGGVSVGGGHVTFTLTRGNPGEMSASHSSVMHRSRTGHVTKFADTGRFERRQNPDQDVTYGFRDLSKKCGAKLPPDIPGKNGKYTGIVDTHPYGTAVARGTTYVADAAGNDVLRINRHGHIRLVTVLPAVPIEITAKGAKANKLPKCTVGHDYWFEPVPTDVEVGPGGQLYVSALTGGPENGVFGPQSRVYMIDPSSGDTTEIADGLAGAVGLAVTGTGDIYVSQLFGNKISRIRDGSSNPVTFRKALQPAAVELVDGHVVATTNVLSNPPAGRLVRFDG